MNPQRESRIGNAVDLKDPASLERFLLSVRAALDRAAAEVQFSIGAESAGTRRLTLQVIDRKGEPWKYRWVVRVRVSATQVGQTGGTQTLTVVTGQLQQTITANQHLVVLTDADGKIEIDLDAASLQTRYVAAAVLGIEDWSGAVSMA